MTKPMIRIHDTETDQIIDREMTDAEFADYQRQASELEAEKSKIEEKQEARLALLDRLGITAEEAALLLG